MSSSRNQSHLQLNQTMIDENSKKRNQKNNTKTYNKQHGDP